MPRLISATLVLACSAALWAQAAPPQTSAQPAPAAGEAAPSPKPAALDPVQQQARAQYEFMLAHRDELLGEAYGQADRINQAIEEYREALHADPDSAYLGDQMAEMLFRNGRTGDAIRMAQSVVREHPDSTGAHALLGRIYLRLLGNASDSNSGELLNMALKEYQALVRLKPSSVENHLILGRLYRASGQPQKARQEFETSLKIAPNSDEAISNLIYLYAEEGNLAAAQQVIAKVPQEARTAQMYAALGFAYEHHRQFNEATAEYRKAVELDPDSIEYRRGLAHTLMVSGNLPEALQQFQQVLQQEPDDPRSLLQVAEIQQHMGLFSEAEQTLKQVSQLLPDNVEVIYRYVQLYEAEGKYGQAADQLQSVLQKTARPDGKYPPDVASSRATLLEELGTLQRRAGNYPAAITAFQQLAGMGGDHQARGLVQQVRTWEDQHNYQKALQVAAQGVQQLPGNIGLHITYGTLLSDVGKTDAGLREIQAQLQGNPQDRELYLLIGQINQRARRWGAADAAARKAESLSTTPQEKAQAQFLLGANQDRQKHYKAAEAHFKQALREDPGNPMILNYLGYMLADQGVRLEEALGYIQQAVHKESDNGAYLDSLGWVYFKMNRLEQARDNLQRAAALKQDDPVVLDHLGQVYFRTGHLLKAQQSWQRALANWNHSAEADYDAREAAQVQQELDTLRVRLARANEKQKH